MRHAKSYITGLFGRTARFTCVGTRGDTIEVCGRLKGSEPQRLGSPSKFVRYPVYEVITVGGATVVVEHRRQEPVFYVTRTQQY